MTLALVISWLLAAVPHTYRIAPGVTRLEPAQVVHVAGIDAATVSAAVAQLNAAAGTRWTVSTAPAGYRPGEVDISAGDTSSCDNDPAADWGCTRTVVRDGAVIWAGITVHPNSELPAVLCHELTHAAGLAHSPDADDAAAPYSRRTTYSPGDRAGFAALGAP